MGAASLSGTTPFLTQSGIACGIDGLYYKQSNSDKDDSSTYLLYTDAGIDQDTFKNDMLGFTAAAGSSFQRTLPQSNPDAPYQFCVRCDLDSQWPIAIQNGDKGYWNQWNSFKWQVTFKSPDAGMYYLEDDEIFSELDRYLVRRRKFQTREMTIPGVGFITSDTSVLISQVGFVPLTTVEWVYTWKQVPFYSINGAAIRACSNTINNATFDPDDGNFLTGNLLLKSVDEDSYACRGREYKDLRLVFQERIVFISGTQQSNAWNMFPDAGMSWHPVIGRVTPFAPPYASTNFMNIFTPGSG